ncbi:MAG: cytochrome c3 family protein [Magnetovibrionaceae bacterium]
MPRHFSLWMLWLALTLVAAATVAGWVFVGGDRSALLLGKTTDAHHQIELACESCHASKPFEDEKKAAKAMNKACLTCHKEELALASDSHPVKKFRDPRNADRLEKLNAAFCVTCHTEHREELTEPMAVTLPADYCRACHEDVGKNRPSHAELEFDTCASGGCHNYHDNKALYEEFLVKHADTPATKPQPLRILALEPVKARGAGEPLTLAMALAPEDKLQDSQAVTDWAGSAHAAKGINCAGCHAPKLKKDKARDLALITENWQSDPGPKVCATCHRFQGKSFFSGKHGMRQHPKLAKPRKAPKGLLNQAAALFSDEPLAPMAVSEGRVALAESAHGRHIGTCSACHSPHAQDIQDAAVEACVACHEDDHSKAYFSSAHYRLWQAEKAGTAPKGSGVSCAGCHLPAVEDDASGLPFTNHNQNDTLRPAEKMIRPVCMDCHGLRFSIDALADPALMQRNFQGLPAQHIESIDWAVRRVTESKRSNE